MPDILQDDLQRELRTALEQMPPPEWLVKMIEHHRRTGTYRPEDLRRLLGDPSKGVALGSDSSLAALLSEIGAK
jgi:hypothetical protein